MARDFVSDSRAQVADKLMELGNIAAGALIFGQAFRQIPFDFVAAILGLILVAFLYSLALTVMKGGVKK